MTQPSLNMTFDTSLTDTHNLNTSFSTTESNPSDMDVPSSMGTQATSTTLPTPTQSNIATIPQQAIHLPTQMTYDQWASTYDSDGNMLQSIDDTELVTLLPSFLDMVVDAAVDAGKLRFLDLGCGTGRNTAKVLAYEWPPNRPVLLTAADFSKGMLEVARMKLHGEKNVEVELECINYFPTSPSDRGGRLAGTRSVHGLLSTLVLEHVDLDKYFITLAGCMADGGVALVTNMHEEMGRVSQAGFVNEEGVKVRGESFVYGVQECVNAARSAGFQVVSTRERAMTEWDVRCGWVGERGRKWVGVLVWFGLVLKRV